MSKKNCYWYSHGGSEKKGFVCYPEDYGARCEFFKLFFYRRYRSDTPDPDCAWCKHWKEDK